MHCSDSSYPFEVCKTVSMFMSKVWWIFIWKCHLEIYKLIIYVEMSMKLLENIMNFKYDNFLASQCVRNSHSTKKMGRNFNNLALWVYLWVYLYLSGWRYQMKYIQVRNFLFLRTPLGHVLLTFIYLVCFRFWWYRLLVFGWFSLSWFSDVQACASLLCSFNQFTTYSKW